MTLTIFDGERPGAHECDQRAIIGHRRRQPAWVNGHRPVGGGEGGVDYVPPIFNASVFVAVMSLVVVFAGLPLVVRSAEHPGRRRYGDSH